MSSSNITNYLLTKTGDEPTSMASQITLLVGYIIGFLFAIWFTYTIFDYWRKQNREIRKNLQGLIYIALALLLRITVSFMDQVIRFLTDNQYELTNSSVILTLSWIGFIYGSLLILKTFIKVPTKRKGRISFIKGLHVFALVDLSFLFILSFIPLSDEVVGGITGLLLLVATFSLWALLIVSVREVKHIASKLARARLKMISLGIFFIVLTFTATPIAIVFAIIGIYTEWVRALFLLLIVFFSILALWAFYNSVFVPAWMKKREGLVIPDSSFLLETS